jgi:hypothetical protein
VEPASLQLEAAKVLSLLSRAQAVFGGDREPAAPPEVKAGRHLEDSLGRGWF